MYLIVYEGYHCLSKRGTKRRIIHHYLQVEKVKSYSFSIPKMWTHFFRAYCYLGSLFWTNPSEHSVKNVPNSNFDNVLEYVFFPEPVQIGGTVNIWAALLLNKNLSPCDSKTAAWNDREQNMGPSAKFQIKYSNVNLVFLGKLSILMVGFSR